MTRKCQGIEAVLRYSLRTSFVMEESTTSWSKKVCSCKLRLFAIRLESRLALTWNLMRQANRSEKSHQEAIWSKVIRMQPALLMQSASRKAWSLRWSHTLRMPCTTTSHSSTYRSRSRSQKTEFASIASLRTQMCSSEKGLTVAQKKVGPKRVSLDRNSTSKAKSWHRDKRGSISALNIQKLLRWALLKRGVLTLENRNTLQLHKNRLSTVI